MARTKVLLKNVVKEFDSREKVDRFRAVDGITLEIYDAEFFALLGPSGCGKTTTLRLIAGFEQPNSGEIWIDDKPMHGIPAYQRPVNTVFQDYVLFPHMNILQNVMFGLQMRRIPKQEAQKLAHEALELVRLPNVATRKPSELSGGQQQRVALARAIVNRPAVLLLDEPLGALDLKLRREMQQELWQLQEEVGITFVFVTHDQEEALTMADRIAVMNNGHVLQVGSPSDIYEKPATRFVADFIGETNFVPVQVITQEGQNITLKLGDNTPFQIQLDTPEFFSGSATLAIRPERITLSTAEHALSESGWVSLPALITQVQYMGTDTRYHVRVGGVPITVRVQNADFQQSLAFKEQETVFISWHHRNARLLKA